MQTVNTKMQYWTMDMCHNSLYIAFASAVDTVIDIGEYSIIYGPLLQIFKSCHWGTGHYIT